MTMQFVIHETVNVKTAEVHMLRGLFGHDVTACHHHRDISSSLDVQVRWEYPYVMRTVVEAIFSVYFQL
jgi:hypothetical protein